MKSQRRQPTGHELTEGNYVGQYQENPAARLGDRGSSGAKTEDIPALELDKEQAQVTLAALEDAAVLRREAISRCPACRSADNRVCTDHEGSWETPEEYDSLRWHLDSSYRQRLADLTAQSAEHQTLGRNDAHDHAHWNGASDYQPDREAGK